MYFIQYYKGSCDNCICAEKNYQKIFFFFQLLVLYYLLLYIEYFFIVEYLRVNISLIVHLLLLLLSHNLTYTFDSSSWRSLPKTKYIMCKKDIRLLPEEGSSSNSYSFALPLILSFFLLSLSSLLFLYFYFSFFLLIFMFINLSSDTIYYFSFCLQFLFLFFCFLQTRPEINKYK